MNTLAPGYFYAPRQPHRAPLAPLLWGVSQYLFYGMCIALAVGLVSHWLKPIDSEGYPPPVSIEAPALDLTVMETVVEAMPLMEADSPVSSATADEAIITILAATAWAEARSQGIEGMRAVIHVILNRSRDLDLAVDQVVFEPWQFSAWNDGDPNRSRALDPPTYDPQWLQAQALARLGVSGQSVDPTNGARFYHTVTCESRGCVRMREHGIGPRVMGDHVFYRSMRNAETNH